MRTHRLLILLALATATAARGQMVFKTEAQLTASDGDNTPLWLNANRYGLSSLETTNGYLRAGLFRDLEQDSARSWKRGFGADVALATGFSSTLVVQQAYAEVGWRKGLLTLGAKEQPMELKNQELSSGPQTLGINARPVPGIRLALPDYWNVPFSKGWLGLKGHLFYGVTTDDSWQRDFSHLQSRYTKHTMLHTKAGYLRLGREAKPFTVELGLEMGSQFSGTSFIPGNTETMVIKNQSGLSGIVSALIPSGSDAIEKDFGSYRNKEGNHVGSWVVRANYEQPGWGVSLYADHFFEDQSQLFLLDYDGYGTGEDWDRWEHFGWFVYDLRDMLVGAELRLKHCKWLQSVVAEYLYTKYQSGPVYHDHTMVISDHIGGIDDYYNHYVFTGWQHWGQVMGNPLYRSPLYNDNGMINVLNNRFWAWHLGMSGTPAEGLHYRLLATWQKGFGTYHHPLVEPQNNVSLMAEARYAFPKDSKLEGWSLKGAVALDRGELLGDNAGMQLTIGKQLNIK